MNIKNPSGCKTITLNSNEKIDIHIEDFERGNREYELTVIHQGEQTMCSITGRVQTQNNDLKKWRITQIYTGKKQKGTLDLRGVAEDNSRLQFDGSAQIEPTAQSAEAHVYERIMLFNNAKGYLLPVLTVKTYNVEAASHSASVAPVEQEKIFYLQSRGIPKKEAEKMIKNGFLQ